jgi:catechol 2,3-dioxygenase-like lactoylglutathione lyase family enzyme
MFYMNLICGLDHVNIETTELDKTVSFYTEILGLTRGWRPDFKVDGAWMYVDEQPIIHLVERVEVNKGSTGAINHIALKAVDKDAFLKKLKINGIDYEEVVVPNLRVTQVFVTDPNKVIFELNFYMEAT